MTPPSEAPEGFRNKIGGNYTLLAPSGQTTQENAELYLTYGAHSNRKLFVEYGFVKLGNEGEVDVQAPVETLFQNRGQLGEWMKKQLVEHGYWGCDITLDLLRPILNTLFSGIGLCIPSHSLPTHHIALSQRYDSITFSLHPQATYLPVSTMLYHRGSKSSWESKTSYLRKTRLLGEKRYFEYARS